MGRKFAGSDANFGGHMRDDVSRPFETSAFDVDLRNFSQPRRLASTYLPVLDISAPDTKTNDKSVLRKWTNSDHAQVKLPDLQVFEGDLFTRNRDGNNIRVERKPSLFFGKPMKNFADIKEDRTAYGESHGYSVGIKTIAGCNTSPETFDSRAAAGASSGAVNDFGSGFDVPSSPNYSLVLQNLQVIESGGKAFPVVGYEDSVQLHWGQNAGAADIMAERGTPVVAMQGGTVIWSRNDEIGGYNVGIRQSDGLIAYYAHMDQPPLVQEGQSLQAGQLIGAVGDSGNAKGTGTHLHFAVGTEIVTGVGPAGGTGAGVNNFELLNTILENRRQTPRSDGMAL